MKIQASAILASVLAAPAIANPGVVFTDATGDIASGISTGNGTLDLVSMEVSHTATDIQFKLTVNGNLGSTDWGKFMIGISSSGTKTSSGNGWGRPINMSSNGGMTHWIGSWVDGGGGGQLWTNGGSGWSGPASPAGFAFSGGATSTITYTVSRASIGMIGDGTLYFDAYSSGGGPGDGAIDALSRSNASVSNWGDSFTTSGIASGTSASTTGGAFAYVIPAPGALALLGVAGLLGAKRRR
jgi:hypothetical protein